MHVLISVHIHSQFVCSDKHQKVFIACINNTAIITIFCWFKLARKMTFKGKHDTLNILFMP